MTARNNVFYWPLSTGNKINTAYNIVPKLAKFFIDTINNCPEIISYHTLLSVRLERATN